MEYKLLLLIIATLNSNFYKISKFIIYIYKQYYFKQFRLAYKNICISDNSV